MIFSARKSGFFVTRLGAAALLVACSAPDEEAMVQDAPLPVESAAPSEVAMQAEPATLQRRIEVNAAPADVWERIGPFCSLADWHPAVGSCTMDGHSPPTRTIVTADGAATFVETEFRRHDPAFIYSYRIMSGPLPLTDYQAMFYVEDNGAGGSEIIWSSVYTPDAGAEAAAEAALVDIYETGLNAIAALYAE